jgi:hypothetical protein
MSFLTIKEGIANLLKVLGYQESEQATSFDSASSNEEGNTFILKCISGEQLPVSENLDDRLYDSQVWQILFAFGKSSQSDKINLDEIHAAKDGILAKMDDPDSWRSFVRFLKYKSWTLEDKPSYYLLTVNLTVTDVFTY